MGGRVIFHLLKNMFCSPLGFNEVLSLLHICLSCSLGVQSQNDAWECSTPQPDSDCWPAHQRETVEMVYQNSNGWLVLVFLGCF